LKVELNSGKTLDADSIIVGNGIGFATQKDLYDCFGIRPLIKLTCTIHSDT
jgi:hypothetical protein